MYTLWSMGQAQTHWVSQGLHRKSPDAEISASLEARVHPRETPKNEQGVQTFRWSETQSPWREAEGVHGKGGDSEEAQR